MLEWEADVQLVLFILLISVVSGREVRPLLVWCLSLW